MQIVEACNFIIKHLYKKSLRYYYIKALREAFKMFDKDKSGYIEAKEIATVAFALGQALTEAELREFMQEADLDGDGRLNYNEFVKAMTAK